MNGPRSDRLSTAANPTFESVDVESLVSALDVQGIAIVSSSEFSSSCTERSHVVSAMDLPRKRAHSSVRMSLGRVKDEDDIEYTLCIMPNTVNRLRIVSPFTNK